MSRAGLTDKAKSLELAQFLEAEARRVRDGLAPPGEASRRAAALRPPADHVADYRADLLARGDGAKHAAHVAGAVLRLLGEAGISGIAEISPDRVRAALGRWKAGGKSARTCNHALGALKAFARWLADSGRLAEVPRGLAGLAPYPEVADRRRVRRALTAEELVDLMAAAERGPTYVARRGGRGGPPVAWITGPERAILYRLAMATGFRAEELRTLTPERFHLEGDSSSITVLACYSKRGKRSGRDDVQPIRRDVAEALKPWLATREPGRPVLAVPEKTALLLRADLAAAGIACRDEAGRVVDFHSLRHSYITHLVRSGVNPKLVQKLARHSTITLTMDRYCTADEGELREALEGDGEAP